MAFSYQVDLVSYNSLYLYADICAEWLSIVDNSYAIVTHDFLDIHFHPNFLIKPLSFSCAYKSTIEAMSNR